MTTPHSGKQFQQNPYPSKAAPPSAGPQKMLLNKQQVQLGESYAIKGDAQFIAEIEETAHKLAEKKVKHAALEAERIINEAKLEAGRLLEEAKTKAAEEGQALIKKAMAEQDDIRETARVAGYQDGFSNGSQEATEKVESETVELLENARAILESAYQAEKCVLENFQGDALALVRFISQKILKEELSQDPGRLAKLIEEAIEHLYLSGRVKVVLGETYLNLLRQFTPKTQAQMAVMKRFEWSGDPLMRADEIHIIANEGAFAIGPDVQIDRLLEPLEGRLPLMESPTETPSPIAHSPSPASFSADSVDIPEALETSEEILNHDAVPSPLGGEGGRRPDEGDPDQNANTFRESNYTTLPSSPDASAEHSTPEVNPILNEAPVQNIQSWELADLDTVVLQNMAEEAGFEEVSLSKSDALTADGDVSS
ncbi:MAG: FliH/SctL family protein [Vampirovibrionales bacterium]|nr:FliH/SctL family protein [Vampirovibrionales bacterium]